MHITEDIHVMTTEIRSKFNIITDAVQELQQGVNANKALIAKNQEKLKAL